MPKSNLPKLDSPLPPAPKRPWGTGSIEVRGRGYMARWREKGRQRQALFGSLGEAETHLAKVYPGYAANRAVPREELRALIADWRATIAWLEPAELPGNTPAEEDEGARVNRLIREAHAQAMTACVAGLKDLLDG